MGIVWRVAATLLILVGAIFVARFLGNPSRLRSAGHDASWYPARAPSAGQPAARVEPPLTTDEKATSREETLRETFERFLVWVAGEPTAADEGNDPTRMKPDDRRRYLAERFNLPQSELPAGVLPPGVEAMMVFEHPASKATRMVLVRMPMRLEKAMSTFQTYYLREGWQASAPQSNARREGPPSTMDTGWLIRYARGRQVRLLFMEPRGKGDETLGVVYDSPN
jgi:hypothetical protein